MTNYKAPFGDLRFTMEHLVDLAGVAGLPAFSHADPATVYGLLEEFGRFVSEVLAPLDHMGDTVGVTLDPATGDVTTPPGFHQAYHLYVESGWASVPFEPAYGGGGFPWLVAVAMQEMVTAGNMAFSLSPLLTQGAIDLLARHGSDEQQGCYLPKMVSGEWTGTMNLTEPDAGSDVGALRTRAVPGPDGTWRITGTKIFITFGEADFSENIIHLVLARVPDAPPGTKGISCFIVPKYLVMPDGSLGERNRVRCVSVEHKLGLHACPTCTLDYDEATGYLIGEANAGMRYMFTMMNTARLSVGLSGLAVAEVAYQQALAYAQERRQGRAPGAPMDTSSPIIDHADVRRMLLTMRSTIEAMRGLVYLNAQAMDLQRHATDDSVKRANQELADLLTPVSKAWCTDMGMDLARMATQVHGGMGFIEETGVAQRERDIRIGAIYEGTNGIQAADLVGRKLGLRDGGVVDDFLRRIEDVDKELAAEGPDLEGIRVNLTAAVAALRQATAWILSRGPAQRNDVLAGATPYLRMFGIVTGGWVMARQALAAVRAGTGDPFIDAKATTARFYCQQLLPQAGGLLAAVCAGSADLFAVDPPAMTGV